eukprot:jgi/Chrzof1/8953/Cz03g30150.t1
MWCRLPSARAGPPARQAVAQEAVAQDGDPVTPQAEAQDVATLQAANLADTGIHHASQPAAASSTKEPDMDKPVFVGHKPAAKIVLARLAQVGNCILTTS